MTEKTKQKIARLKASCRDIEELNKVQCAIDLIKEDDSGTLWVIANKIDKLADMLIKINYDKVDYEKYDKEN